MTNHEFPKITLWRTIVAVIFLRRSCMPPTRGSRSAFSWPPTSADPQPWGLWVGLGTLCGVGISAGGFAIAAAVYLLGFERYRPVVRAAVLVSFLGYSQRDRRHDV